MIDCSENDLIHLGGQDKLSVNFILNNAAFTLDYGYYNHEKEFISTCKVPYIHTSLVSILSYDLREIEKLGGILNKTFEIDRFDNLVDLNFEKEINFHMSVNRLNHGKGTINAVIIRPRNSRSDKLYSILDNKIALTSNSIYVKYFDIKKLQKSVKKSQTFSTNTDVVNNSELKTKEELTKRIDKPLADKERGNLYRIIAALSETLLNENSSDETKPHLKNQSKLIEYLDSHYDGYNGLSKSNLENVLPDAKKLLNPS